MTNRKGQPYPLGSSKYQNGVNFAIFSQHATRIFLEFFNSSNDDQPSKRFELTSEENKTNDVWHIWIKNVKPGQLYGYRVEGPFEPDKGHRFNPNKLLIDPYTKSITPFKNWDYGQACGYDNRNPEVLSTLDNAKNTPKCVYVEDRFDWDNDISPQHTWNNTIIYEMHLKGLTIDKSSHVKHPGTYLGVIEKIPYFKELGVTAIEFLPIFEFNHSELGLIKNQSGESLKNYWGYDTVCYFSPKSSYSYSQTPGSQITEFKTMVRELHKANIEVILDVVFNHTAEGNENGPTLSFRGIDNSIYYHLEPNKRHYKNYAGCGNTVNANHPIVLDFILDCLQYWVSEMRVDGFRFDLASLLNLDEDGFLLTNSPLIDRIVKDPILKNTKLIAEPWAPGGIYQVGNFSTPRWSEWNDKFRDEVRRFWRGDEGMLKFFATRFCGSSDIFTVSGKSPSNSINFITCHDGFTLNDVVSFNTKHNEDNGQNNEDGANQNESTNYGIEGKTNNQDIELIRIRQIKNFFLTLFTSRGVPMLLGGDEFRRTQKGNNNAYCQDNSISWFNWNFLEKNKEIFQFVKHMIQIRKSYSILSQPSFYSTKEIEWFNPLGDTPQWENTTEKMCACCINQDKQIKLYFMFNAYHEKFTFKLPAHLQNLNWTKIADTSQSIQSFSNTHTFNSEQSYHLEGRSSVILKTTT